MSIVMEQHARWKDASSRLGKKPPKKQIRLSTAYLMMTGTGEAHLGVSAWEAIDPPWQEAVAFILRRSRLTFAQVRGEGRTKDLVACRRELSAFLREKCGWSYPRIGKWMNRDHTSILNLLRPKPRSRVNGVADFPPQSTISMGQAQTG